jgi:hypothetical protein
MSCCVKTWNPIGTDVLEYPEHAVRGLMINHFVSIQRHLKYLAQRLVPNVWHFGSILGKSVDKISNIENILSRHTLKNGLSTNQLNNVSDLRLPVFKRSVRPLTGAFFLAQIRLRYLTKWCVI